MLNEELNEMTYRDELCPIPPSSELIPSSIYGAKTTGDKKKLAIVSKIIFDHRDATLQYWGRSDSVMVLAEDNIFTLCWQYMQASAPFEDKAIASFREVGDDAYCRTILRFYFTFCGVFLCLMTDARGT